MAGKPRSAKKRGEEPEESQREKRMDPRTRFTKRDCTNEPATITDPHNRDTPPVGKELGKAQESAGA